MCSAFLNMTYFMNDPLDYNLRVTGLLSKILLKNVGKQKISEFSVLTGACKRSAWCQLLEFEKLLQSIEFFNLNNINIDSYVSTFNFWT